MPGSTKLSFLYGSVPIGPDRTGLSAMFRSGPVRPGSGPVRNIGLLVRVQVRTELFARVRVRSESGPKFMNMSERSDDVTGNFGDPASWMAQFLRGFKRTNRVILWDKPSYWDVRYQVIYCTVILAK